MKQPQITQLHPFEYLGKDARGREIYFENPTQRMYEKKKDIYLLIQDFKETSDLVYNMGGA